MAVSFKIRSKKNKEISKTILNPNNPNSQFVDWHTIRRLAS